MMKLKLVSDLKKELGRRDSLVSRFISNATRQGIGVVLFFGMTALLVRSLGIGGYAVYFASWNVANLVVIVASFGIYDDLVRRLTIGESTTQIRAALWKPLLAQQLTLLAAAFVSGSFGNNKTLLVYAIANSLTIGNFLTAMGLGCDRFKTYIAGELTYNTSLLILVALIRPTSPEGMALVFPGALCAKAAVYGGTALRLKRSGTPFRLVVTNSAGARTVRAFAGRTYLHFLLLLATFRSFFLVTDFMVPIASLEGFALAWSFCDRSLLVVQGVNQLLYPKLVAGQVRPRLLRWTRIGTVSVFVTAVAVLSLAWRFVKSDAGSFSTILILSALTCLAFVPHVLRLLLLNERLATYQFKTLFASHAAAISVFLLVLGGSLLIGLHDVVFPILLVFSVSAAGLIPIIRQGIIDSRSGRPTAQPSTIEEQASHDIAGA